MIKASRMASGTFLQSLKDYVGFTDRSTQALQSFHAAAAPHFATIIDDFYATIEAHPGARAAITGGSAQIERLKRTLIRWLETLLLGPHDEAYFERRARIGRVHVAIDLPQAYMFTAMDRIRVRLLGVARDEVRDDPRAAWTRSRRRSTRSWTSSWRSCSRPIVRI